MKREFALIRYKGRERDWLLIKKNDQYVNDADILEKDRSVIFGMSLKDLGKIGHSQ